MDRRQLVLFDDRSAFGPRNLFFISFNWSKNGLLLDIGLRPAVMFREENGENVAKGIIATKVMKYVYHDQQEMGKFHEMGK